MGVSGRRKLPIAVLHPICLFAKHLVAHRALYSLVQTLHLGLKPVSSGTDLTKH